MSYRGPLSKFPTETGRALALAGRTRASSTPWTEPAAVTVGLRVVTVIARIMMAMRMMVIHLNTMRIGLE